MSYDLTVADKVATGQQVALCTGLDVSETDVADRLEHRGHG